MSGTFKHGNCTFKKMCNLLFKGMEKVKDSKISAIVVVKVTRNVLSGFFASIFKFLFFVQLFFFDSCSDL